jgi:uncharacterized RDD family membrane protein YckC
LIIIFGWKFSDYFLIMMRSFYAGESSILQNETIGLTLYNAFGTFFYYLIFEGFFKTTPAKILMGTKVLYTNREVPSFGDIFRRTVCRFIPIEGLFFILNHRWHDTFSETSVYDIEV